MSGPTNDQAPKDAGVRNYTFLCLSALLVLLLVLLTTLPRWLQMWSLIPILVGLGSLILRWRLGPLLLIVTLVAILYVAGAMRHPVRSLRPLRATLLGDVALCGAVLAYVAGHYRLQGLVGFIFPRDPRRPTIAPRRPGGPVRRPALLGPQQRSPGLASPGELLLLVASLPLWVGLALLSYRGLVPEAPLDLFGELGEQGLPWFLFQIMLWMQVLAEGLWRARLLLWLLGGGVLLVSSALGYLTWRRRSPTEAAMLLQDAVWEETRREQRRQNSWLVWDRLRRQRRKETS